MATVGKLAAHLATHLAPRPAQDRHLDTRTVGDAREPIAIVGAACRVPGAANLEELWTLLVEGMTTAGPVPTSRWDADRLLAEGVTTTARGSFLADIDGFDHGFFRVSPREARSMDPQQRLFLEVAWEALEDAGFPADRLRDSRTGVFTGLNTTDYQELVVGGPLDLYYGTGTCFSGAAGRLSYLLGLRGPSLAVDTACSSSLTAVHLACQSLRTGESDTAVAGGANVMATPTVFRAMSAAGALAPDGRCKTFDDAADGYGRGEGAGAVVLKRLSSALSDGDRVLGVIRGSAINQDGASGGLTVPSGQAQQDVVRDALQAGNIGPEQVDYVEAHGTGTPLGDVIELRALGSALRPDDATAPLLVGSVKANLGHLEAAAGVIGLIKVLLAFDRGAMPAHVGARTPTRQIDWDRLRLRIPNRLEPWQAERRIAGISAFGFTGTNVHVVVETPPARPPAPIGPDIPRAFAVSAASESALESATALMRARLLRSRRGELADLCWTSLGRRTHHAHRVVVLGFTLQDLADALEAPEHHGVVPETGGPSLRWATGGDHPDVTALVAAGRDLIGAEAVHTALSDTSEEDTLSDAAAARRAAGALWGALGVTVGEPEEPGSPAALVLRADGSKTVLSDIGGRTVARAGGARELLGLLAALHVRGVPVDWARHRGGECVPVQLPPYPWQRTRHWVDSVPVHPGGPAVSPASAGRDTPGAEDPALIVRVRGLSHDERVEALLDPVMRLVEEVLGDTDVDPDRGFFSMGMDSVLALRLKRAVERTIGSTLPDTMLFECPTPRAAAEFVVKELYRDPGDNAVHTMDQVDGTRDANGTTADVTALSDDELSAHAAAVLSSTARTLGARGGANLGELDGRAPH